MQEHHQPSKRHIVGILSTPLGCPAKISNPESFLLKANCNAYVAKQKIQLEKNLDTRQKLAHPF